MATPAKVLELVDHFSRNADAYRSAHYKEAQVRQEFINPLFRCLGWDMENEQGYAEAYKDVIHENAIEIGGTQGTSVCPLGSSYVSLVGAIRRLMTGNNP